MLKSNTENSVFLIFKLQMTFFVQKRLQHQSIRFVWKGRRSSKHLSSSPSLLVFQPPRVPPLVQELQGSLASQALRQALGVPVALVPQWPFLEDPVTPQILEPLVPLWHPVLLETRGHPDRARRRSVQQTSHRWGLVFNVMCPYSHRPQKGLSGRFHLYLPSPLSLAFALQRQKESPSCLGAASGPTPVQREKTEVKLRTFQPANGFRNVVSSS